MKKTLLLAALLLFSLAHSQTTNEEYNYLTIGYENSLELGLELKDGYSITEIHTNTIEDKYKYTYFKFYEIATKTTNAILIKSDKIKDHVIVKTNYICLPLNNKELHKRYFEEVSKLGFKTSYYYNLSLSLFLSEYYSKTENKNDLKNDLKTP